MRKWGLLAVALSLTLAACGGTTADDTAVTEGDGGETATTAGGSRLDVVKERGTLICGVDGGIPGFSFVDESGAYSGL